MKKVFRLLLVVILGIAAVGLDMTLWHAWRSGQPGLTPIRGVATKYGITTADPMTVFSYMTVLFDAAFLAAFIGLFPSAGAWLKRKKDGFWPPIAEEDPGPVWICAHCHEENPGNFEECWKCQRNRPPKSP